MYTDGTMAVAQATTSFFLHGDLCEDLHKQVDKTISIPRGKGAIVCMKPKVGVVDRDNYVVPIRVI